MGVAINKKTNKQYTILNDNVINCTNKDDGKRMVLYTNYTGAFFVREYNEFSEKFNLISKP